MSGNCQRRAVLINGIVQGVGFRPFIYNLAHRHRLTGFVANNPQGVEIEIQGPAASLAVFLRDLRRQAPPLAVFSKITCRRLQPAVEKNFQINTSQSHGEITAQISPDITVCEACRAELFNPADRRYRYPFINCTNCGPRFTIIDKLPYDRPATAMREFKMCDQCRAEYDDPASRRFHAQPNCCPLCGPQVAIYDKNQLLLGKAEEALRTALVLLRRGKIIAIKGIGGFHLAVDAANDQAVAELRRRKGREEKPLALMVADPATARRLCHLDRAEIKLLQSPAAPIVLAAQKTAHGLAPAIAPQSDLFGLMLPAAPLHYLLFDNHLTALVMTSGNYHEEPICRTNQEAFGRLAKIADYFLTHNREIYKRNDDSLVMHLAGKSRTIRRSRGLAPRPLPVKSSGPPLLAVGGELKNTICLLKDDQAILSQHLGDLKNLAAYNLFQKTIAHLQQLFEIEPALIVHDLHPGYLSSRWARDQQIAPGLAVQHHHAHLASCLAENHLTGPAIGLIMDGSGYGPDGTSWGGEILIGDFRGCKRYGHFEPMPLPGGDAAVKAPWRTAVGYLARAYNGRLPDLPFLRQHDSGPIIEMVAKNCNSPQTSSCGRLFDAVAAICGLRSTISYEAQAAIELMQAARNDYGRPYPCHIVETGGRLLLPVRALIKAVAAAVGDGESITVISQRFHQTLIGLFTEAAGRARQETGLETVVLSGGVFQNRLLFTGLIAALQKADFTVATHAAVPANDGGIALGQAMIGRYYLEAGGRKTIGGYSVHRSDRTDRTD